MNATRSLTIYTAVVVSLLLVMLIPAYAFQVMVGVLAGVALYWVAGAAVYRFKARAAASSRRCVES